MKYNSLRAFMMKQKLSSPYNYAKKELVIDGLCFEELYKNSGCDFILGGEYDRFSTYMKNYLSIYLKSGIKCYIVFNGAMQLNFGGRKNMHQKIIDRVDAISSGATKEYCKPIFLRDVCIEVLNELKIKHYTCMYDSKKVLFSLANKLKCPILSNSIEYTLYNVSVIPFKSVEFNEKTQSLLCSIYFEDIVTKWCDCSVNLKIVLLAATNEDCVFYRKFIDMFKCKPDNYIAHLMCWIRYQTEKSAIRSLKNYLKEESWQNFMGIESKIRYLFLKFRNTPAVQYLVNDKQIKDLRTELELLSDSSFEYHVGTARISTPFISLKNLGILSGSWVVFDKNREDAMLVVTDIALYAHELLTGSKERTITFIGRKHDASDVSVIKNNIIVKKEKVNKEVQKRNVLETSDYFIFFLDKHLPGFVLTSLVSVPEDCWMLLIALLYYNTKARIDITIFLQSIILSYVLLGPVSEKVGIINRNFLTHGNASDECLKVTDKSNVSETSLTKEVCAEAAGAVADLFCLQENSLKRNFDRDILHTLAECQHSLQYINCLNKLCGEKIKSTIYHKTINCTFIYNLCVFLKDETSPRKSIKKLLNCPPVYLRFKNILDTYIRCASLLDTKKSGVSN